MAVDATLLTAVRTIAGEIAIPVPTTVVAPNQQVAQLVAQCNRAGELLKMEFNWPFMRQLFSITPAIGTSSFVVANAPYTCNRIIPESEWDSQNFWKMVGPVTDAEWAQWKFGIMTQPIRKIWRMADYQTVDFFPTIDSTNASIFQIYFVVNEWAIASGQPATAMAADADTHGFPPRLLISYAKRNFLEAKGLPYGDADIEYQRLLDTAKGGARSSRNLNMARRSQRHFINYSNTPDTGYGNQ